MSNLPLKIIEQRFQRIKLVFSPRLDVLHLNPQRGYRFWIVLFLIVPDTNQAYLLPRTVEWVPGRSCKESSLSSTGIWSYKVEIAVSKRQQAVQDKIRPAEGIHTAAQLDFKRSEKTNNILDK